MGPTTALTSHATVRLARDLVASYGEDAQRAASARAEALEKIGNSDAAQIWAAVSEIILRMRRNGKRADH